MTSRFSTKGYHEVHVTLPDRKTRRIISVHRIIWFLENGEWPEEGMEIDHINGIKTDNRITNLRVVSSLINNINKKSVRKDSKTGITGVTYNEKTKKYKAELRSLYKTVLRDYFDTLEEAVAAYNKAKEKHHTKRLEENLVNIEKEKHDKIKKQLLEDFDYDSTNGVLTRKVHTPLTKKATGATHNGSLRFRLRGVSYATHCLVWLLEKGELPSGNVKHINGINSDNRISNLTIQKK